MLGALATDGGETADVGFVSIAGLRFRPRGDALRANLFLAAGEAKFYDGKDGRFHGGFF